MTLSSTGAVSASSFSDSNTNISTKIALYPDTTSATSGQSIRVHSSGNYFITQNVDTTPTDASSNLIVSKGVYDAIAAVNTRLTALELGATVLCAMKYDGVNDSVLYNHGFSNDASYPLKIATGHYKFEMLTANRPGGNQYCVHCTVVEGSTSDDIVCHLVSGQLGTSTFEVRVTEQDDGGGSGTLRNKTIMISVIK